MRTIRELTVPVCWAFVIGIVVLSLELLLLSVGYEAEYITALFVSMTAVIVSLVVFVFNGKQAKKTAEYQDKQIKILKRIAESLEQKTSSTP